MNNNKQQDKYLDALKTFDDFITYRQWAEKFKELYPKDFERIEEEAKKQKTSITGIRELTKRISSNKKIQKFLLIKENSKPKKIKYHENDTDDDDNKYIKLHEIMKNLEYLRDDIGLPHRDDRVYRSIEQLNIGHFKLCMIFEMATRNKEVIEIINKLDFIEELKDKHPYLEHEDCLLFKTIEPDFDAELQLPMLTEELKKEFEVISKMPIAKFQEKLEFLVDIEYSNNYNGNWYHDMINDGIEDDPYKITDELYKKYKHKTLQGKTTIDDNNLTCGKLYIIFEYLQNKLKNEYFIYPEGYYKELEKSCHEEVISKDMIIEHGTFNFNEIPDDVNKFRSLKPTHMKDVADLFFMYDYYTNIEKDGNVTLCREDIKFELTKYNGIKTEDKKTLSYEECLERYEEFKNLNVRYCLGEKAIENKIKLMKDFIDKKLYRFILSL